MENKPVSGLITSLQSGNEKNILHAITQLGSMGNPDYLPFLFPLLLDPVTPQVKKEVLVLLSELKYQKAVPLLIQAIANPSYESVRKELITCCWENGLDFSDQLSFFTDLVIESDFEIAFEAFTVIDSMENFPDESLRYPLLEKIDQAIITSSGTKSSLMKELYLLLK